MHTQLVANEYATRYLESIGVKPNRATMDLVQQNVPLTKDCIKTTLRSEGRVSDGVQITAPRVQHVVKVRTKNSNWPLCIANLCGWMLLQSGGTTRSGVHKEQQMALHNDSKRGCCGSTTRYGVCRPWPHATVYTVHAHRSVSCMPGCGRVHGLSALTSV